MILTQFLAAGRNDNRRGGGDRDGRSRVAVLALAAPFVTRLLPAAGRRGEGTWCSTRSVSATTKAASPAVDGVDLTLTGGSLTTLVGPSGCGKSSLLALIAGWPRRAAGPSPSTASRSCASAGGARRRADGAGALLFPHMTVAGNVGFGLRMRGVAAADLKGGVAAMLALVRLAGFGGRRPHELSGGQAQRVALARALVTEPPCCCSTSRSRRSTPNPGRRCAISS